MTTPTSQPDLVVPLSAMTAQGLRARVSDLLHVLTTQADRPADPTLARARDLVRADLGCAIDEVPVDEPVEDLGLSPAALRELRSLLEAAGVSAARATLSDLGGGVDRRAERGDGPALADIAFTLACGREAMPVRLAVVAASVEELCTALQGWLDGRQASVVFDGQHPSPTASQNTGSAVQVALSWTSGVEVDWDSAFADTTRRRVALPAYRFSPRSHWVSAPSADPATSAPASVAMTEQGPAQPARETQAPGSRWIRPDEAVVAEHLVAGRPTVPGVAHLSMAYAEAVRLLGRASEARDVLWSRTATVPDPGLRLHLVSGSSGPASVRISVQDVGARQFCEFTWFAEPRSPGVRMTDVAALARRCATTLSVEEFYSTLQARGLEYGPRYRGLTQLQVGDGVVVARAATARLSREALDLTLLDAALQSVAALHLADSAADLPLPFAVDRVTLHGLLPDQVLIVTLARGAGYDIDVVDDSGRVVLELEGLRVRRGPARRQDDPAPAAAAERVDEVSFAVPVWRPAPLLAGPVSEPGDSALVLFDGDLPASLVARLRARYDDAVTFAPLEAPVPRTPSRPDVWVISSVTLSGGAAGAGAPVLRTFTALHDLLDRSVLHGAARLYVAVGDVHGAAGGAPEHPASAGILGLVRSLSHELRALEVRLLSFEGTVDDRLVDWLAAEPRIGAGPDVLIGRDGVRRARHLVPVALPPTAGSAFRDGGTYLVVGGAGGIGLALSEHLAERYRAHVVLTGRSPLDDGIRAQVGAVTQRGGTAQYRSLDVTDAEGMRQLVAEVSASHGLDGVIHAAMVLDDAIVENHTPERFAAALAPKIDGTVSLLQALEGQALDVVLILGSVQSFVGAAGQASYAAACTGQDAVAQWGRRTLRLPVRVAHLGPWGEVGAVSAGERARAVRDGGWPVLTVPEGIGIIERLASADLRSLVGVKGRPEALQQAGLDVARSPVAIWTDVELDDVKTHDYEAVERRLAAEVLSQLDGTELRTGAARRHAQALRSVAEQSARGGPGPGLETDVVPAALQCRVDLARECLQGLPGWAAGTSTAHDILFADGEPSALTRFYRTEPFNARAQQTIADQLVRMAAQRAGTSQAPLRVLEVGAGVGSTTIPVVRRLRASGHPFRYQVTDVSQRLVGRVRDELGTEHLEFGHLDLTEPTSLLPYRGADVVVAGNVLHAVPDVDAVVARLGSVLADGGTLVLSELTRTSVLHTLVFGLLDGWWVDPADLRRVAHAPLLDVPAWRDCLEAQGFGKTQVTAFAPRAGRGLHAVITARKEAAVLVDDAYEGGQARPAGRRAGAGDPVQPERQQLAGATVPAWVREVVVRRTAATLDMPVPEVGLDAPFASMGVDSLVGVELVGAISADLGIVLKTIVVFDHPTVQRLSAHIVATYGSQLQPPVAAMEDRASEPSQDLPEPAPEVTARVASGTGTTQAMAVLFEAPANGAEARVAPIEVDPPRTGELEIAVRAFPINFSDDLVARGLYPMMPDYPVVPGIEVSGVVTRVGPGVVHVAPGEEVIALTRPQMGGQATAVVVDADFVVRKPREVSHEQACSVPAAYLAMSVALDLASVQPGETVLITGATGNNGMVAVQLAKRAGARVVGTASTPQKVAHLRSMGVEGICHRDDDVASQLRRLTSGAGADVVINTLGGAMIQDALRSVAPNGRYVETAVFGLQAAGPLDLSTLVDNQSFFSLNAKKYFIDHPEQRLTYLRRLAADLGSGAVVPATSAVFDFPDVAAAYRAKADRDRVGRVVVRVPRTLDAATETRPPVPRSDQLSALPRDRRGGPDDEDVAIVGMSARYAGAPDLDGLWQVLAASTHVNRTVPDQRWDRGRYVDPDRDRRDTTYCDHGYFVEDVDEFDPAFFGMSGREASQTDPQQRLFLQEAWRALEIAGVTRQAADGLRMGVFVGAGPSGYEARMNAAGAVREAQSFWGNESSVLAARISYALNLTGPSIAINTACSSSLVALHLARRSLLDGDCDAALTGGVFLMLDPQYFVIASNGLMLAPDGRSKTFSADADGFGPGEGVGVLVLRRLSDALRDGDHIWGVIRGSAINQDGKTNGITAPNGLAQAAVIRQAMSTAAVHPRSLDYVEAHGTGTRLGDPVEVEALSSAFRSTTADRGFCALGSAKAVIGHSAAAAGVAGVIKVCLAFENELIPGMPPMEALNPLIDFAGSPFTVAQQAPWPRRDDRPRRAGVSSFGFSGTNAHVILQEAPATTGGPDTAGPWLFPVTAQEPALLTRHLRRLASWVLGPGARFRMSDVSATLATRRDHGPARCVLAASTHAELAEALRLASVGDLRLGAWCTSDEARHEALRNFVADGEAPWPTWDVVVGSRAVPVPPQPLRREAYWFPEDDQWHRHRPATARGSGPDALDLEDVVEDFLSGSFDEDEALLRLGGRP